MKKNIILSLILISLGIFTYQFEEVAGIKNRILNDKKDAIIDEKEFGKLLGIKAKSFNLVKVNDHFESADGALVEEKKLSAILEILEKIKIRRYLGNAEYTKETKQSFFSSDDDSHLKFKFEKGELTFKLGNKLEFDQSFYIEIIKELKTSPKETQIAIAFDSSANEGIYQEHTFHKNSEKYTRFKSIMNLPTEYFIGKR